MQRTEKYFEQDAFRTQLVQEVIGQNFQLQIKII